jgi:ABC-type bacteriocin/lantibiotic exporter with double-glycine peptidase domain
MQVDAHVGRHLFEQCIMGYLRGATRVLVTNQLHVLPRCDRVLVMHDGRIVQAGRLI